MGRGAFAKMAICVDARLCGCLVGDAKSDAMPQAASEGAYGSSRELVYMNSSTREEGGQHDGAFVRPSTEKESDLRNDGRRMR